MSPKTSPITSAQQGVYIDCVIDPENLRYNNPKIVSFPASIPPEDVAEAVRCVLECHPALFSHFEERDGVPVQVYAGSCKAEVGTAKVDDAALETIEKDFVKVFDIGRGPLYRAEVLAAPSRTVLLMDFHHLVYDGFSLNILMNGICSALDGIKPSAEPSSYAEYAFAQQADTTDHKSYYAELFKDGVTPTQMPSDLGGENGPHAECVQFVSAPDVMSRAKALGTAPSALFMAAAYYTLSRYANTRDLCLTTISNGRLNPLSKGVVGMFISTFPLVSRIGDVSVLEFIHDTRRSYQEIRQHEEYPFPSLANDYGLEQHVRFTYQWGTLGNAFDVRGVKVKADALRVNSHPFPFTIAIKNIDERPAIAINYDTAMYSADLAGRFAESMDAVLSHFLENPQARLLSVSIMSGRQKEEVEALHQTCFDHSAVRFPLFHNSIEYWAEHTPDATAVIACNETLTYREFNVKANVLAHTLIERGVQPGDRVCLLLPRKSWHLLAMFGVMKAGAAYIPCDPEYPSERIKLITEDSHARFVITTADKMADYGDHALDIEELLATAATDANIANPGIEQGSESLAYLIYTSGSTGRPKGVMLRHIGICNYLTDHEENRHFHALVSQCRTMLCITTVSFDLSLKEIGSSLYNGMTLVFADEAQVNDPQALADLMLETGVDGFSGTPSRLKMFLDLPDFRNALSKCKFIVLGGEKYPPTLLPQLKELAPDARLFNTYGPTEISVSCNGKELTHSDRITIGRPLLNVREYVVDNDLNELPVGVTGELLIGGLGVAVGYNDLPEKTAEAFIGYKGGRFYKSGDYAYWNPDGDVVILGRKDNQIKLNGLRIELGEVETVLNRQPQVKEGVVMIRSVEGHDHLVAYYVPVAGSGSGIVDDLKEQMGRSLTHYMVPTIFVELEKMPVSPNGKTDLKALPAPSVKLGEEEKTKPETADEKALCDIVAEVVGNSNFGTTTNLISVGLTSLLAIRLSVFVNSRMNATLPVHDILRYSTVRELAARLQREKGTGTESAAGHSAPLSFSQLGIYSECAANPDDIQYNIPVCLTMPQGITAPQLKSALLAVLDAHPYINMHFQIDDRGDTYQCPIDGFIPEISEVKLSDMELEKRKADFVRPFALQDGPLYRLEIAQTPSAVHLLADFHHLIMDGGSLDIFYRQLCQALDGKSLEKEKYDYYQFVTAQKIEPSTEQFFEEQLSRIEEASALLPDLYDTDDSHRQGELSRPTDLQAVQAKCKELGITPASLYLASVMLAVSKYTAEETVGICTISNGRSNLKLSGTFGMFVNTLPLVGDIDPEMPVDDFLRQIAGTFVDTLANEDYPFGRVVEKFGYAPNIMFAYQVGVLDRYSCGKGEIGMQKLELQKAKFPVAVFIEGSLKEGGVIKVQYDSSLFSEDMMKGFADAVNHVAAELLTKQKTGDVSISDDSMLALLDSFNVKDIPVTESDDADETVLSLFKQAVERCPDNVAAVFNDKKYTYRQLDVLTDRIGALIYAKVKDCGKAEPVVSILIPRNEYMFILPLAAIKAGCAYQPLDPSYPKERLNFMVKDADAALLISDPGLRDMIDGFEGESLLTDGLDTDSSQDLPASPLTPQSLFILLYTSGSTGEPKGVMLEHQNLVAFIKWYQRYYCLRPEHKVAAYASFGFDANMMDMYPALTTGATVHIIAEDIRLDLVALNDYFETNGITHSFITTQVGVQFLQNTENHSLSHLSVGGEKLVSVDPAVGYTFHNGYGPTECTVFSTILPVLVREPNIPIGKPTDRLDCYVVDKQMHRLPVGAAGELIIVGKQVGRGYLNRPEKTAEVFFTMNGERAYHSGDIVRYRQDGNIEFVGRKDGQVKIRGFRVELKEVEAVIRDFEGIRDVTVQAFDDPAGGKFIAAYVVGDGEVDIEAIKDFILDRKPPYMVPAAMMQIDSIPLNVNQKVDRKALPKLELKAKGDASCGKAAAAPLNALEVELKAIVASVINTEDFTITDVLGYAGLNSISSIRLAALIYKKFGVQVNTKSLVKSGSLQSIENEILLQWMRGDDQPSVESAEEPVLEAPLTFPQQGVFMDCQMNPDTTMYNMPTILEFPSETSPEDLGAAVKTVVGTHPALLCNFFQTSDGVVMRHVPGDRFDVPVRMISPENIEEARQAFVRPFDLEHDTLVRAEICSVSGGPVLLMLDIHHLVGDGASLDLCIKQILALMEGRKIDGESLPYLDFAKEQAAKTSLEGDKAFFDEMFATYESAANVPADKSSNEEGLPRHITAPIPEALLNISLPQGVTKAHFWFAAFNYALSRFANTKDVYTTFISSGRQDVRLADTAGMFVNTLPCAVHVKDQTVREFIQETSEAFYGSLDHENYPFARIASDYDFKGYASFAYQMGVLSAYSIGGKAVVRSSASLSKAKIPFSIFIQNVGGVPSVDAEYDDSKYSRELALHFAESIVAVAEHFAADMDAPVKQVSIMSERQRQEVEAMHIYRKEDVIIKTIHEGFEQWAEKTPEAMAIISSDRCLTYGEYNAEANRLARALLARGVRYGDRIVLLLPRRSYYLTSLFAVMKIGAAFIPMDPEYPADRIAYILDDSEGRFVLTTDDKLTDYPDRALSITELLKEAESLSSDNLNVKVDPYELAYVIYTSGSTGRPKGVMIEHFGASNFLRYWTLSCPGLDMTKYIAISQATVSFDYSIAEFGMQLFNGATVAFANEEETKNPMEMIKFCKRFGINAMNGTPSRVAINMEIEDYKEMMRSQMKLLTVGGEKLPWTMVEEIKAMGITLVNAYGPTETSMGSSAAIMNDARQVHVGKPFPNYSYMILDSDRNELPVGVMGELCIGGVGLARGYNNMPERTAETFIMWHGERIYRTGDYAMWTDEGNVIIMGRTDNQVKLNGLRIELGEVETVMKQQDGIRQCVAAIKKVGNIDKLIGYYTTFGQVDETQFEEEMRRMMGEHLTPYMVPGIFMHLDEMPLTPVGKTDVKRLPLPEVQIGEYVAPANDIEKLLCEAFATTLKLDKVGATNNFFELGGTSLVAMRLVGLAVKAGLNVVYKNIFDNPTPRLLAKMLRPDLYSDAGTVVEKEEKELYTFQKEVEDYDYSALDEVLEGNTLQGFKQGRMYDSIGNVFLTGATGFLGIHVLHNLICRDDVPHIYCLVRGNKHVGAASRLRTLLFYYFNNTYEELFGDRIVVIEGDVTDAKVFQAFDQPLDLVINCAANVKHFSAGTDIEDINIGGCRNCIDLCLHTGARFVQTSTGSVTGTTVSDKQVPQHYLTERELYFGQAQFSKYSCSKFLAERAVLDAIRFRGLKGKIVRLGNLCARSTDGEFQINFRSNTFMGKLKAYHVLGCVPYSIDCGFSEFSPINEVADAIIRLSLTPDGCTVFHPVNVHWPPLGDVIECMNHLGLKIERVEDDVFAERLDKAMTDEGTSAFMQSLVGYKNTVDGKFIVNNTCDVNHYTAQVLLRLGFRWSYTSWDYVESYLRNLIGLGVFDKEYKR